MLGKPKTEMPTSIKLHTCYFANVGMCVGEQQTRIRVEMKLMYIHKMKHEKIVRLFKHNVYTLKNYKRSLGDQIERIFAHRSYKITEVCRANFFVSQVLS
jgi:hypothetical protein